MAKCSDYWCEYYDKNKGDCAKCLKNEEAREKSDLSAILERHVVKQMGTRTKNKSMEKQR